MTLKMERLVLEGVIRAGGTILWREMNLIVSTDEAQPATVLRLLIYRPRAMIDDRHSCTALRFCPTQTTGNIDGNVRKFPQDSLVKSTVSPVALELCSPHLDAAGSFSGRRVRSVSS